MIARVRFHRFKQFPEQTFDLRSGVTLLGGGNNDGKSTLLHGLAVWEFCRTAIEMERDAGTFLAGHAGQGLGLGDDEFSPINVPSLKHLWTNLKTQRVEEADGYTLLIRCDWAVGEDARHLEFGLSLANDRLFVKTTDSNLQQGDTFPRFAYLPPFAGMTDRETRTTGAIRRRRVGEGLAGAVLRNILLDMYERNAERRRELRGSRSKISDADLASLRASDPWELLQSNLRHTFGAELDIAPFREEYHSYIKVEVLKGTAEGYRLKRHPGYNKRDLMVEGSGFLQWLSVFALAIDPGIDVLLLDEPDAHLHPSLQDQLLESLEELAPAKEKQVLIATHSSEILRNTDPSRILHISAGKGRYLRDEQQKAGMLVGLGSEYAPRIDGAKRTKRILFVEGRSDVPILKTLAERLGIAWPTQWIEWTTNRTQKERKQIFLALQEEVPDLRALSLRDRDDKPAEEVGPDLVDGVSESNSFFPRRWRRRYIESYLVWPPAMAAARGVPEEQVAKELAELHGLAVGAGFTKSDPPQALLDVRAKDIFRGAGTPAILGQLDVDPLAVSRVIEPEAIPEDVRTFLRELVALA